MPSIPTPILAGLGLIDTAVDRARELIDQGPELPMQLVGNALQLSMKAQQRFTELTIRGDDLIARLRGAPDEAPAWATFDDEVSDLGRAMVEESDVVTDVGADIVSVDTPEPDTRESDLADVTDPAYELAEVAVCESDPADVSAPVSAVPKPTTTRTPTKRTAAKKAPVRAAANESPAVAGATARPATKPPAKKSPVKKSPAQAATKATATTKITATTKPTSGRRQSKFDLVDDLKAVLNEPIND